MTASGRTCIGTVALLWVGLAAGAARADEALIAVAANFLNPVRALEAQFESATGHELEISSGSTGQLYAQIANGAPFDVLLAADRERPRRLAEAGLGDESAIVTYAVGRLALFSAAPGRVGDDTLSGLRGTQFRWFAIAQPEVAPYGAAARQALEAVGVWESIQPRLVKGQNVAQTFAMIETGNAELGLVALSQVLSYAGEGSYRQVPERLHDPIRQDALLLNRGSDNPAAIAFMEFLGSDAASAIVEAYGYSTLESAD